jgi:hypothetical protein
LTLGTFLGCGLRHPLSKQFPDNPLVCVLHSRDGIRRTRACFGIPPTAFLLTALPAIPDAECLLGFSPQPFHGIIEDAEIAAEVLGIVVPPRRSCVGGFRSDAKKERGARCEDGG